MNWQEEFRKQFPVTSKCVYLDNAYDCGGALWGREAAIRYFDDWEYGAVNNERGGPGRATLFKTIDETRELLLRLVGGTGTENIAFTRNTNEGINAILQGFDFKPGDNIVTDGQEHESVLMPCLNAGKTRGVEVRVVPARSDGRVEIDELTAKADSRTRLMLVSHVQSATGFKLDVKRLGNWCRERGIFLVVDAIQSLGLEPFYADLWNVDAVSAAGYKGLCAVNSVGFIYGRKELWKHVWPVYAAANAYLRTDVCGSNHSLVCTNDACARKLENSSMDNLGIYVMHESLKRILTIGPERIREHVNGLFHTMYEGLSSLGYKTVTPLADEEHSAVLALLSPNKDEMFSYFRSRNICLSISAGTYIRFSLGAYNSKEDVESLLKAAADCPVR